MKKVFRMFRIPLFYLSLLLVAAVVVASQVQERDAWIEVLEANLRQRFQNETMDFVPPIDKSFKNVHSQRWFPHMLQGHGKSSFCNFVNQAKKFLRMMLKTSPCVFHACKVPHITDGKLKYTESSCKARRMLVGIPKKSHASRTSTNAKSEVKFKGMQASYNCGNKDVLKDNVAQNRRSNTATKVKTLLRSTTIGFQGFVSNSLSIDVNNDIVDDNRDNRIRVTFEDFSTTFHVDYHNPRTHPPKNN